MVRFDYVLDAKMNVYLMEVNMSPNLSTKHFVGNRLLYEQVIFNLLNLVGIARPVNSVVKEENEMQVSDKDISVFSEQCSSEKCSLAESCDQVDCRLCQHCLSSEQEEFLKMAYLEHLNRHATRRIFPRPVLKKSMQNYNELSTNNALMHQWFLGKCLMDEVWCH